MYSFFQVSQSGIGAIGLPLFDDRTGCGFTNAWQLYDFGPVGVVDIDLKGNLKLWRLIEFNQIFLMPEAK